MKATIGLTTLTGYIAPTGWLYVNGTSSKTRRNSYSIAKIYDGMILTIDPQQALRDFTNEEIAQAFVSQN